MRWRTIGRVAVTALVGLLVPVAVAAVGIARATSEIYTPRDATALPCLSNWPRSISTIEPGFGFDASLRNMARTRDLATAHWGGPDGCAVSRHESAALPARPGRGPSPCARS